MIDPGNFNRHLLMVNWIRATSVAEANINARDIMINEVFTISILQTQHIRPFYIYTTSKTFWRITLNLYVCILRQNRLIYADIHCDKSYKVGDNRRVKINLKLNFGSITRICNKSLWVISTWEVTTNKTAKNKFWLKSLK